MARPTDWERTLERVLSRPDTIEVALQPIADLHHGSVVGHEMLARFPAPPELPPDQWFAAAELHSYGPRLAAHTVRRGLNLLAELPPNTFLTINVEPQHLSSPEVLSVLERVPRLDRLFVELTEHVAIEEPDKLCAELDVLRARGARIAIDDAGAGYAGLSLLLSLRPELVKLDRGLINSLDRDPAKRVLVRAMGELASTIDAWVLAEGIETEAELGELVKLEVPLGQGYLLGRPQLGFTDEVPADVLESIADRRSRNNYADLAVSLQERVPIVRRGEPAAKSPTGNGVRIIVDELSRPVALDLGEGYSRLRPLLAKPSEPLTSIAQRAIARDHARWSEPVVLADGHGAAVGILAIDRLLERLAQRQP